MNRRSLLLGLGAALAAPAVIRTPGLLMPVRRIEPGCDLGAQMLYAPPYLFDAEQYVIMPRKMPVARFIQHEVYDDRFERWIETTDTLTGRVILNADGHIPSAWYAPTLPA